jgi:chitinase
MKSFRGMRNFRVVAAGGAAAPANRAGEVAWGRVAAAWSPSGTYVSRDVVSYNGDQWTANQWNHNEVPGGAAGAWNNDGPC